MNTNSILSLRMDQESFALNGLRLNSTSNLFGVIQIHAEPLRFIPPLQAQVQLIGREQIGNSSRIIVNDTFYLSSCSNDWQLSSSLSSILSFSPDSIKEAVVYSLPFSLSVPSNIPSSFQIVDQEQDFVCCGIYYTLEVRVSSIDQSVIQPIYFHQSSSRRQLIQSSSNSSIDDDTISTAQNQEEEEDEEGAMPKRLFWGITKQSKQRWQYELEFSNKFDLVTSKSGSVFVRLRSVFGNRRETNYCCLIGCQIIQLIHLEGYQSHVQVLATATKLLTNPNATWSQACQIEFELEDDDPVVVLPTVDNERLGVEHCIRISIEFCNTLSASESYSMDLQFPVVFTGCSLNKTRQHVMMASKNKFTSSTVTNRSSISTCSAICNYLHPYKLKI